MTLPLIIRPEAEEELSESYDWYERQRPGLGDDFLLRVEAALDSIRYDPEILPAIYKVAKSDLKNIITCHCSWRQPCSIKSVNKGGMSSPIKLRTCFRACMPMLKV